MASPKVSYPTVTLSNFHPITGERQLRRTPLGLRRMYSESESSFKIVDDDKKTALFGLPLIVICCIFFLIMLILLAMIATVVGIVHENQVVQTGISTEITTDIPTTIPLTTQTPICDNLFNRRQDLYLLIDTSRDLSPENFNLLRNFLINKFLPKFIISNSIDLSTRFALVGFDQEQKTYTSMATTRDNYDAQNQLQFMRQHDNTTTVNLGSALRRVRTFYDGNRPAVRDIVLVFIGKTSRDSALEIATQLRNAGAVIMIVKLGPENIDVDGIPTAGDEFTVRNLEQLPLILNTLVNVICLTKEDILNDSKT